MTALRAPAECPECKIKLEPKASVCPSCGWKVTTEEAVPVVKVLACDLTHMCARPAKTSVFVEGKRINCCLGCYHEHRDKELKAFDPEQAALQREEKRERLLKRLAVGVR